MAINALPMWRKNVGRHALDDLKARLHAGECGYILFPEGARSRDGSALKWKAGIGMMVAGTDIPVIPCRLDGAFDALRPETSIPRPVKIRVEVFPEMRFAHEPNSREGWDRIAAALKARVVGVPESSDSTRPPPAQGE
jgi:1-acyl-sn-glycerol-3-phosphate acyltransferase